MDIKLQTYYEERFALFSMTGWKDLIEDMQMMKESTDKISGINTEAELYFKKGELSIVNWVIGLEELSINTYEEALRIDAYEELKNAST